MLVMMRPAMCDVALMTTSAAPVLALPAVLAAIKASTMLTRSLGGITAQLLATAANSLGSSV